MKQKEIKIEIPKGYEIDKEKSTFENIVFKKINNPMQKIYEYHNTTEEDFDKLYEKLPKHVKSYTKEVLVVDYYNKGEQLNTTQTKYYPYFQLSPFGFNCVHNFQSYTYVPLALCFKNKEDVKEAVEKYIDVFKENRLD